MRIVLQGLILLYPMLASAQESGKDIVQAAHREDNSYILAVKDVLTITIFDEENLNTTQPIDGNHEIKMPLIGKIKVGGLTVREAEALLEKEFTGQGYLRQPLVTIQVQSRKEVFVLGEINSPGIVQFRNDVNTLNIVELIAMCKGFTQIANQKKVEVSRRLPDGTFQTIKINVEQFLEESERDKRDSPKLDIFEVKPGDIVFVPQRFV